MYDKIVIGIDQSYTKTGISVAINGSLIKVTSEKFKGLKTKSEKRRRIAYLVDKIIRSNIHKCKEMVILCERIRTFSHGPRGPSKEPDETPGMFISTGYIKATGALIATIVDTAANHGVKVYSVDTRSWKSKIVGSSKRLGGDPKLRTIIYVQSLGFNLGYVNKAGNTKYDDDAADSACIALYGFLQKGQTLKLEE